MSTYPFELVAADPETRHCLEWIWENEFDKWERTLQRKNTAPRLVVDLEEALKYGEQQGSVIIVFNPFQNAPPLKGECELADFSTNGYSIFWEVGFEHWAFNEVVFLNWGYVLKPGTYYCYIQMENKYYMCAEPFKMPFMEFDATGCVHYRPTSPYDGFGLQGRAPTVYQVLNPPFPVENILGLYYSGVPVQQPILPVQDFISLHQPNELNYFDVANYLSFRNWGSNFDQEGPQDGVEQHLLFSFDTDKSYIWTTTIYEPEGFIYNPFFLHIIDWDGLEKAVNTLYLYKQSTHNPDTKLNSRSENNGTEIVCSYNIVFGSLDAEVRPSSTGAYVNPSRIYRTYKKSRNVEVFKIPKHWHLDKWFGTMSGKDNPLLVKGNQDHTLIAILDKDKVQVQLNVEGNGQILGPQSYICDYGDTCYAHCVPNENWEFVGWKNELGHIVSKNLNYSFKATKQENAYTAVFKICTSTLRVKSVGTGTAVLIVNGHRINSSELFLGRTLTFDINTQIIVEVIPNPNSHFVHFIKGSTNFILQGNDEIIVLLHKNSTLKEPVFSFIPYCVVESEV